MLVPRPTGQPACSRSVSDEPLGPLAVEALSAGDLVLVTVAGNLDGAITALVRDALDDAFDRGAFHVLIDATSIVRVDAVGLDVLADASCYARFMGGRLVMAHCQPRVVKELTAAGYGNLLDQGRDTPRSTSWWTHSPRIS